jgi:hypothetical protein
MLGGKDNYCLYQNGGKRLSDAERLGSCPNSPSYVFMIVYWCGIAYIFKELLDEAFVSFVTFCENY